MDKILHKLADSTNHTKNLVWVSFANILARLLFFLSGIVVARYLFPKDFGIIGMALTFSSMVECLSQFGIESFFIYKRHLDDSQSNTILITNLFISAIFAIIMILASLPVSIAYNTPEIKIILIIAGLAFFINRLGNTYRLLFWKNIRLDFISKIEIFTNLINSILIILFAILGFKYLCYVLATLISQVFMTLLYVKYADWKLKWQFDSQIFKELFKYSRTYMPQTLLSFFAEKIDYIIVGYFLGANILGYYYFGFEKAILIIFVLKSVLLTVYTPIFSSLQNNFKELNSRFLALLVKISYFVYPFIFGMIILAPELLNLIFGTRWNNSILTFQLILAYAFFKLVSEIIIVLFNSIGHSEQNLRHYIIIVPVFFIIFYSVAQFSSLLDMSIAAFVLQTVASCLLLIRYCSFFKQKLWQIIIYPAKILCMLILQLPLLVPFKIFLNAIHANMIVILLCMTMLIIIIYYIQTILFLKNQYKDYLLPLLTRFVLILKKLKGQSIEA